MEKFPTDRLRRLAGLPHSSPSGVGMAAPTILGGGSDIRLKWHMLRRERRDAPHLRANLAAGLAAGAALEVDLRLLADGRFACLHDETLEAETSGAGPVADVTSSALAALRVRDAAGGLLDEPPLTLAEVAGAVADGGGAGTVQLDLMEGAATITPAVAAIFSAEVAPAADRFVLSGDDAGAVRRLGAAAEGIGLGIDPSYWKDWSATPSLAESCDEALAALPGVSIVYLRRELIAAGRDRGDDPVAHLHARGVEVDCWTIDADAPDAPYWLGLAANAGVDQITTNTPGGLAHIWTRRAEIG